MSEQLVKDPYGFIYITNNMINGKRYIGQRVFKNYGGARWETYLGSGKALKNAIKKYGKENFYKDIVAIAYSKEELNKLEIEWIKEYNAVESDNYYNIKTGGANGNPLAGKSEEEIKAFKEKLSVANKGEKHPLWKGGEVLHNCDYCGKEHYVIKARLKRSKTICCSKECASKMKSTIRRVEHIRCNCDYCDKELELQPCEFKRSIKHFCNIECAKKYRKLGNEKKGVDE